MAERSSADSVTSTAPRFSSSRAALVVPGIGTMSGPWASSQARASWAAGDALRRGYALQGLDQSEVLGQGVAGEARLGAAEVRGVEAVDPLHRAGQEAAAQRAVGHQADAQLAQGGQDLGFRVAGPQRILALDGRDRMDGVGLADGLGSGLGQPEPAHLAGLDQVADGAGHVLDRHGGVDPMLVEEIDDINAQALQRGVGDGLDVLGPAVDPETGGAVELEAELGGDPHLVADRRQAAADQLLVDIGSVDLGGVEECHAPVDGVAQQGDGVGFGKGRAIGPAQPHAAEAKGGDFEALGSEFAGLHWGLLFRPVSPEEMGPLRCAIIA